MRRHLLSLRRAVLGGSHILFSRIIPLDCPQPHMHPLWRLAEDVSLFKSFPGLLCLQVVPWVAVP